jgi:16S rRNA (guanine1516-N2)-methyltransferase
MSLALYCLEQAHADVARDYAESLGAVFHAAWPEQPLAGREFNQHRRHLFAGLQIPLSNSLSRDITDAESVLIYDAEGLALQTIEKPLPGPVRVDFADVSLQRRISHGHGAGEAVARACGLRKGTPPRLLDATAGLGRDSWILASLGAQVEMLERVPLVHALLTDGLRRARLDPQLAATAERVHLLGADALAVLQAKLLLPIEARPEVVYLDPMFPHRDKSAKVKKDMWVFRHVVGSDIDADALLVLARAVATKRVVVKRPRIAPDLNGEEPHQRMLGQSSRFDLYTPHALS